MGGKGKNEAGIRCTLTAGFIRDVYVLVGGVGKGMSWGLAPGWLKALAVVGMAALIALAVIVVSPRVGLLRPIDNLLGLAPASVVNELGGELASLRASYTALANNYTQLRSQYSALTVNYSRLVSEYNALMSNYTMLMELYAKASANATELSQELSAVLSRYSEVAEYTNSQPLIGPGVLYVYPNGTGVMEFPVYVPAWFKEVMSNNEVWHVNPGQAPGVFMYGNASLGFDIGIVAVAFMYPNGTIMNINSQFLCSSYWPWISNGWRWNNTHPVFRVYLYTNVVNGSAYITGYPNVNMTGLIEVGTEVTAQGACGTSPIGPFVNGTTYPIALELDMGMPVSGVTIFGYSWYWWAATNMTVIIK